MEIRVRTKTAPSDPFVQYYSIAVQVLYYYDYFLTLSDEVLFILLPPYDPLTLV